MEPADSDIMRRLKGIYLFLTTLGFIMFLQAIPSLDGMILIDYLAYTTFGILCLTLLVWNTDLAKWRQKFIMVKIDKTKLR